MSDVNSKSPLGNLIETAQNFKDWSDRQVTSRAESLGFKLGKSNYSRLKNQNPLYSINASQIHALSKTLDIAEAVVARAAVESMAVTIDSAPARSLEDAVRTELGMSDRDRRLLLALITQMRTDQKERASDVHPPTKRAGVRPAPPAEDGRSPEEGTQRVGKSDRLRIVKDDGAVGTIDPETGEPRTSPSREWLARHDRDPLNPPAIPSPEQAAAWIPEDVNPGEEEVSAAEKRGEETQDHQPEN